MLRTEQSARFKRLFGFNLWSQLHRTPKIVRQGKVHYSFEATKGGSGLKESIIVTGQGDVLRPMGEGYGFVFNRGAQVRLSEMDASLNRHFGEQ